MIDLSRDALPSALLVGGEVFPVDTSFRIWIKFEQLLTKEGVAWGGIFPDRVPDDPEWIDAAVEFMASENATPKRSPRGGPKALDLVLDGDYITAAFQQAYGIDLTSCDMHWHRFKALLNGLPEDTMLSRIMGYRTYEKRGKVDREAEMQRLRDAWALPDELAERKRMEALARFEEWAG